MSNSLEQKFAAVLDSSLLDRSLVWTASGGASIEDLDVEEIRLGARISKTHRSLLLFRNGMNLEVIRFFSCGEESSEVRRISDVSIPTNSSACSVPIGDDPDGFLFLQAPDGSVTSFDHDGGLERLVSKSLEEFVCDYIFGIRGAEFGGSEWLQELEGAGLLT